MARPTALLFLPAVPGQHHRRVTPAPFTPDSKAAEGWCQSKPASSQATWLTLAQGEIVEQIVLKSLVVALTRKLESVLV